MSKVNQWSRRGFMAACGAAVSVTGIGAAPAGAVEAGLYHEPARKLPIARDADVVVVGGGPAGFAAAMSAARNGARVVLVEQFGYLGGTATASLMANINGFRNQVEPDATQTVRGIAEEVVLELKRLNGLGKSPYPQKSYSTLPGRMEYSYAVDPERFKYVILRMSVEAGVDLMFHTWFCDSIVSDGAIRGVIVENKSGRQALLAKVVVDASGDADVSARAGVPFWQAPLDKTPRLDNSLMYRIQFGDKRPAGQYNVDFGRDAVVWGPGAEPMDGTNGDALSKAEIAARLAVYEDFAGKQKKNAALADAKIIETPPLIGVRQTRFIEGEYKLTADDAIEGHRHGDVVAMSSCAIISYYGYRRYLKHEGYDIPYRCLVPKGVDNLLAAGRCISSEQQPYESHRAMIPIMAIGQAAGTAAALCVQTAATPRNLDVPKLQNRLKSQNAVLGLGKPA
ncbi:MAG TPA: FAD-dependent oxidoreductase [Candidatus Bathyarchaeia archaeon]|nr:FAD-dependent oxidoreductase [Candidatus Bathyarchaeia archaeon]